VGFFTINPDFGEGFIDWEWLGKQRAAEEGAHVRHLKFDEPVLIKMDGKNNRGVIFKPGEGE
jgi:hypothetical protein